MVFQVSSIRNTFLWLSMALWLVDPFLILKLSRTVTGKSPYLSCLPIQGHSEHRELCLLLSVLRHLAMQYHWSIQMSLSIKMVALPNIHHLPLFSHCFA